MSHVIDKLKFGVPADAIVMACPPDVNPDDDSVRYYGGLLVCESASFEWRRRIVACVNACCGIPTDQLDAYPSSVMRVMRERDELLSVMRLVASEVTDYVRPTSADSHLPSDIVEKVHAVIASIEGYAVVDDAPPKTSIPAIVFCPAGSLGEAIEGGTP